MTDEQFNTFKAAISEHLKQYDTFQTSSGEDTLLSILTGGESFKDRYRDATALGTLNHLSALVLLSTVPETRAFLTNLLKSLLAEENPNAAE